MKNLKQLEAVPKEKLQTFMVMYRAHCQRILDSVVRANFDEVREVRGRWGRGGGGVGEREQVGGEQDSPMLAVYNVRSSIFQWYFEVWYFGQNYVFREIFN